MAQAVDPYRTHSRWTDPGRWAPQLAEVPAAPADVARVVSGLILDPFLARLRDVEMPAAACDDNWQARSVEAILGRLLSRDPRPLECVRAPRDRFFGCCRHYAVLATALFRAHGIPARARVGFAAYFTPGFLEDHWVCEYRDRDQWRLLDANLDEAAVTAFAVAFSPSDVPRGQFVDASSAWRRVRAGDLDPASIGLSELGLTGLWFVGNNVLRDAAALNREEMLPFDCWSLARETVPRAIGMPGRDPAGSWARAIDRVAALLHGAPDAEVARAVYQENDWLRVTPTVLSFQGGVPTEVAVA